MVLTFSHLQLEAKVLLATRRGEEQSLPSAIRPSGTIIALRTRMYAQFDWTLQELEEALNCCPRFCAVGEACEMRLEGPWSVESFDDSIIVSAQGTISMALVDVPLQRKAKELKFRLKSQRLNSGNFELELVGFRPNETHAPRDVAADMLLARRAKQNQKFLARATQILPPFIEPNGQLGVQKNRVSVSFSSSPGVRSTAQHLRVPEQGSDLRFPSEAPSSVVSASGSAGRYSIRPNSVERVRLPDSLSSDALSSSARAGTPGAAAAPLRVRKQTA